MSWTIGVDVGGTFTDFYGLDEASGAVWLHKRPSTPDDPGRAIVEGIEAFLGERGGDGAAPRAWHHGRHQRADPAQGRPGRAGHDARLSRPARDRPPDPPAHVRPLRRLPAAARAARAPLRGERADPGRRLGASAARSRRSSSAVVAAVAAQSGAEACAICFLFGYLNPAHEQAVAAAPARGAARPASVAVVRGAAGVPRVRALLDHRPERLSAAGDGALSGAARGGAGASGCPRPRSASTSRAAG